MLGVDADVLALLVEARAGTHAEKFAAAGFETMEDLEDLDDQRLRDEVGVRIAQHRRRILRARDSALGLFA